QFPAQEQMNRVVTTSQNTQEPRNTFQSAPGTANVVLRDPSQTSLAVSPNGLLAVERANGRQAKTFFARPEMVAGWNDTLMKGGSYFQLRPRPDQTVTFNSPATNTPQTLIRVDAQNLAKNNEGCDATIAGSCEQAVLE